MVKPGDDGTGDISDSSPAKSRDSRGEKGVCRQGDELLCLNKSNLTFSHQFMTYGTPPPASIDLKGKFWDHLGPTTH